MNRKLVMQGGRAYTLTLPIEWIRKQGLSQGDEISIEELPSGLLLRSDAPQKQLHITLSPPGNLTSSALRTLIVNAYRQGYDSIDVQNHDDLIETITQELLLGFDCFRTEKGFRIEALATPDLEDEHKLIVRMLNILTELCTRQADVEAQVKRIQRYDNYLKRSISKQQFQTPGSQPLWQFLSNLTQIARARLHLHSSSSREFTSAEMEILECCREMIRLLSRTYTTRNSEFVSSIHDTYAQVRLGTVIWDSQAHHLLQLARVIYLANSPLVSYLDARAFAEQLASAA